MSIATEIANLFTENHNGMKASHIAKTLGMARRDVNRYLYSHLDEYHINEDYIWTQKVSSEKPQTAIPVKSAPRKAIASQDNLKDSVTHEPKSTIEDPFSDGSGITYYRIWKVQIYDGTYAYGVEFSMNNGKRWLQAKSFSNEWEAEIYLVQRLSSNSNHRLWGSNNSVDD